MTTMNISLPDDLKSFVDARIRSEGYGSSSEYMRELIRRDRARAEFHEFLLAGLKSKVSGNLDRDYFSSLRKRVRGKSKKV